MLNFLEQIGSIISLVIDFVVTAVTMLIMLVTNIPTALAFLASAVVYLPEFLTSFVLLFVGTAVVLQVINKGE